METQSSLSQIPLKERIKSSVNESWNKLDEQQKSYAKKAWNIITYKWKWQIAMNIPYLAIFALDRTIPAVHKFNMGVLIYITDKLPIPDFINSWVGIS